MAHSTAQAGARRGSVPTVFAVVPRAAVPRVAPCELEGWVAPVEVDGNLVSWKLRTDLFTGEAYPEIVQQFAQWRSRWSWVIDLAPQRLVQQLVAHDEITFAPTGSPTYHHLVEINEGGPAVIPAELCWSWETAFKELYTLLAEREQGLVLVDRLTKRVVQGDLPVMRHSVLRGETYDVDVEPAGYRLVGPDVDERLTEVVLADDGGTRVELASGRPVMLSPAEASDLHGLHLGAVRVGVARLAAWRIVAPLVTRFSEACAYAREAHTSVVVNVYDRMFALAP